MQLQDHDGMPLYPGLGVTRAWQTTLLLGVLTLILGLIVSFHPAGSLNVVGVLLGVLLIISGIFHLIRVFDSAERHRVWLAIAGLVLVIGGLVLIRHLHLTVALIGLVVGVSWIVQGLSAVIVAFSGGMRERGGWWVLFGIISLIAGIVVMAMPSSSVTVLAVLTGIWFVVIGLADIAAAFILRHAARGRGPVTHDTGQEATAR